MSNSQVHPSPEMIMKIGTGFWASKVLLTAVNLQLFTNLALRPSMAPAQIKEELGLGCTDRHLFDFLDTLTGFGFLTRTGILETAAYSNSPDTELFLDKQKPTYIGGILEFMNHRLYNNWSNLEESLVSGLPQGEARQGINLFEELYKDAGKLKSFVHGMTGVQVGGFIAFAQKFDFSNYKTLTDAGGSAGMLSLMVAKHQAHMTCTSFDLPPVEPIAAETIAQFKLSDRVKAASGDFFKEPIPVADIVVMGNIIHDWDEPTKILLIKRAYEALPDGGAFVAIENIIDDERRHNVFGMMMSLNMLIETGKGFDYTFADFRKWAALAGFKSTSLLPLAGPTSAAIAYK